MDIPTTRTPGEAALRLDAGDLALLGRAVADVAGQEAADEVLFRLGRRLGEAAAGEVDEGGPASAERLRAGLRRLDQWGLGGGIAVQTVEVAGDGDCRVVGSTVGAGPAEAPVDGSLCSLGIGFVTGLTAGVTGLDVVCTPLHCLSRCGGCGCTFEVRPGHRGTDGSSDPRPPSGSARFFLDSMGRGMGQGDISLSALLEHTPDAVILIDAEDIIRYWNEGAERMFQYPRAEAVGRRTGFILPDDLREQDELGWIRARLDRGEALENHVTRRIRRDGTELVVSLTRTPLRDSQGRVVGSTAVIRDITDWRRTEDELARVRTLAMVGELAAKVAHEVKNPLSGIYAAMQLLARDRAEDDPELEILNEVQRDIRRLNRTIEELLDYARPTPPRPRATDLASFVADLVEALNRRPKVARHRVVIDVPPGTLVDCDTHLVGQVIDNIVFNAGQAMEEPGTIAITAREDGERVRIEIRDTGPGIPAEALETIFDPFFTTKTRGTGLGLSIARKNVETHGGVLEARNTEPGAAFTFSLPRSSETAEEWDV